MYKYFRLKIHETDFKPHTNKPLIPQSYLGCCVGKPGAGKTLMIKSLLESKEGENYVKIIYITTTQKPSFPSHIESKIIWFDTIDIEAIKHCFDQIKKDLDEREEVDEEQEEILKEFCYSSHWTCDKKSKEKINSKITKEKVIDEGQNITFDSNCEKELVTIDFFDESTKIKEGKIEVDMEPRNKENKVLMIFDDCITRIKQLQYNPDFMHLMFNRRWLPIFSNILIVTQKYTYIPSPIRSNIVFVILFQQNQSDLKVIKKELLPNPPIAFELACQQWWNKHSLNFVYIYEGNLFGNFEKLLV